MNMNTPKAVGVGTIGFTNVDLCAFVLDDGRLMIPETSIAAVLTGYSKCHQVDKVLKTCAQTKAGRIEFLGPDGSIRSGYDCRAFLDLCSEIVVLGCNYHRDHILNIMSDNAAGLLRECAFDGIRRLINEASRR